MMPLWLFPLNFRGIGSGSYHKDDYNVRAVAAVMLVCCGPSVDIHKAAKEGNIEVVKQHIAAGADVNAKRHNGRTLLHEAARPDNKEIVELLIEKGADINAKADDGVTPLHQAADAGNKEIAKLLIANGVDVNAKDHKGETSLDFATNPENQFKSEEFIELLRKHGGKTAKELKAEGK